MIVAFRINRLRILLLWLLVASFLIVKADAQSRTIRSWLDFAFDADAPIGSEKNPAVIVPAEFANLFTAVSGAKRIGDTILIPAVEFQKLVREPLASVLLGHFLDNLNNVKSFDGFNAIDLTGVLGNLPSEIIDPPDSTARKLNSQNTDDIKKTLRDGDIVFGAHVINYMTWGRFNHVAIVVDAGRGTLAESTAELPTDMPGVRLVDWKKFATNYSHIGVVRLKTSSGNEIARVVRWVNERRGKPYRWPIIQGLDKLDQSRFYCSQLVWLAFKDVLNLDLDLDKGVLVFPDDIYYSKQYVNVIIP